MSYPRPFRLGVSVVLALPSLAAAWAAAGEAPPTLLTATQAVEEALANNLGILAERLNLTIAEAAVITARLRPNPVFSFSSDHLDLLGTGFNEGNGGGPPE